VLPFPAYFRRLIRSLHKRYVCSGAVWWQGAPRRQLHDTEPGSLTTEGGVSRCELGFRGFIDVTGCGDAG
jgi:hypothetical protein